MGRAASGLVGLAHPPQYPGRAGRPRLDGCADRRRFRKMLLNGGQFAHNTLRYPPPPLPTPLPRSARRGPSACLRGPLDGAFHRRLPRQRVVRHHEVHRLQPLDLVAQARRFLEFEVLGGLAHLVSQPLQMRLQVGAVQRLVDLGGDAGHVDVALVQPGQDVVDIPFHRRRRDPVRLVVGDLLFTPAVGLADRPLHAAGFPVGIHDHPAVDVARRAPDGLHEARL